MKRNIISSKVEPQNTEDLWLNLVDGNIYSYEYGSWTNVNNVPNRVFNLDIDYTEENLTKFLSPLYEEGFSDDDFPKKVWDKYCEINPEFKLQGEKENIRINVGIKGQEGTTGTPLTFKVNDYNKQEYLGNIIIQSISEDLFNNYIFNFTINLYDELNNNLFYIDSNTMSYVHGPAQCLVTNVVTGQNWHNNNMQDFLDNINTLGILNKIYYADIKVYSEGGGNGTENMEFFGITILKDVQEGKPAIPNIASADIKLKSADSTFSSIFTLDDFTYGDSLHNIEYVSGCVSNKLNLVKVNEYLGDDVKHLLPAKIDLILPSDVTISEALPDIINNMGDLWDVGYPLFDACMYAAFLKKDYLDIANPYIKYNQLQSPIEVGLYKDRVNKNGTPIDVLCTSNPTELKDVYIDMNVKYSDYPEYWNTINNLAVGISKHYYFIDTYLSFKYDFKFSDSIHEARDFFSVFIADLNICLSAETLSGFNIYSFNRKGPFGGFVQEAILYTGTSWEDIVKYAKNNYSLSEETKYKLVYINADVESTGILTDIIIPTPDLKPIEYIQFVGSDYEYADHNEVTFNDVSIVIIYGANRIETKPCHILDKKTGIEYSLTDLGYNENFIWLPEDIISDSSNQHNSSSYMLASDFKNILDRFNILNRKHSSVEVDLEEGSNMEQNLGTHYIFNVIDSKDKDKDRTEIVKLLSQTFIPYNFVNPDFDNQMLSITRIFEVYMPADITLALLEELEKEGWEVNYE